MQKLRFLKQTNDLSSFRCNNQFAVVALIILLVLMYMIHGEIRKKIQTSIQPVSESTDNIPIICGQMQTTQLSTVRTSNRLNISTSSVPLPRLPVFTVEAETRNMNQASEHRLRQDEFTKENFIFYNRVPKCGSETLISLIKKLSKRNKFKYPPENLKFKPNLEYRYETESQMLAYINKMFGYKPPVLFSRHLYFVYFDRYRVNSMPTYMNLIRDPIERKISEFNYKRFRRDRPHKIPPEERFTNMNTCVLNSEPECDENLHIMIPFFCGSDPVCRNNSDWALNRAKLNIKKYYAVVGTLDQLEDFLFVLEMILPRYFTGVTYLYKKAANISKEVRNKTFRRSNPSQQSIRILKEKLKLEYDLFHFVQQRFNEQFQILKRKLAPNKY